MESNAYLEARSIEDRKRAQNTDKIQKLETAINSSPQKVHPHHGTFSTAGSSTAASPRDRLLSGKTLGRGHIPHPKSKEPPQLDRSDREPTPASTAATEIEIGCSVMESWAEKSESDVLRNHFNAMEQFMTNLRGTFEQEINHRDNKLEVNSKMLEETKQLAQKLEDELQTAASQSATLELELDTAKQALAEKDKELQRTESKRIQAEDEIEDLANKMQQLDDSLARSRESRHRMQSELTAAQCDIQSHENDLSAYKKLNAELERKVKTYESVIKSSNRGSSMMNLQESEDKRLEAERKLSDVEKDLAICTTKLNLIVYSVTMQKLESKSDLMARAPSNPEGLTMVMKGSNHEVLRQAPRDVRGEKYRACTPVKSPNVTRHKWVDPVE